MEDPDSEWEIQEYPSSKENETTTVEWILNNGCTIGKKLVITGIIFSSAPLVLPPLVVVSAMGVAFSVPFGLLFAGYACTNKLMSILLPIPKSPLMLQYNYANDDERKEEDEFKTTFIIQEEHLDDINHGVECRIQLDEVSHDYWQIEGDSLANKETILNKNGYAEGEGDNDNRFRNGNQVQEEEEEQERILDVEEKTDHRFELDENRHGFNHEFEAFMKNVVEYEKENKDDVFQEEDQEQERTLDVEQNTDLMFELDESRHEFETSMKNVVEDVKEMAADVVQMDDIKQKVVELDDGGANVDNSVDEKGLHIHECEDDHQKEQIDDIKQGFKTKTKGSITIFGGSVDENGYEEDDGEYLEGDDDSLEEERKEIEVEITQGDNVVKEETEDETEDIVKGSTGLLEKFRDERKIDDVSNGVFEQVKTIEPVTVKDIASQKLMKKGSENEAPIGEIRKVVVLAEGNEENNFKSREVEEIDLVAREVRVGDTTKDGKKTNSKEKVMRESMGSQEKPNQNITSNEVAIPETKEEQLIKSNVETKEISEESANMSFGASDNTSESATNDGVDALETFRRAPSDLDHIKVVSKNDIEVPSLEDKLNDEKMWEKIGAMRAVVGYKAPSQATFIGELKALYVFTGVEPPTLFENDSNLDEVNDKLKFLMSIVGVK